MQYVKKPIPINAVQIETGANIPFWLDAARMEHRLQMRLGEVELEFEAAMYLITTDHGVVEAHTGDWILQGPSGEIYPITDAKFVETYDPAPKPSSYPLIDSFWRHHNGNIYKVLLIANSEGDDPSKREKYPVTVVYSGINGRVWARPFSLWHSSMTPAGQ